MPNIGRDYVLTQTTPIKYESLEQCLYSELFLPKYTIEYIYKNYQSNPNWTIIQKKKLSHIYKDINNPLTDDEKFAIFLYSIDQFFYTTLSYVLNYGTTSQFNCYFQYLRSGFDKIKNSITENQTVYRGVRRYDYYSGVHFSYYHKGETVYSTSFTSTSLEKKIGYKFSCGMLFQIKTKRNPKSITELSNFPEEFELLYPPATKFIVTDDPYQTWCYYDTEKDELYCADSEEQNYYNEYIVIPLEEVDMDYGPIATIKNEIEINKKIFWWGWLLIGIGIGVVISGLIALIVVLSIRACSQKKDKSDLEQNEKVTHFEV